MPDTQLAPRNQIFGIPLHPFTLPQIIEILKNFIQEKKPHQVVTLNSLMANDAYRDSQLRKILAQSDLVICDSIGIFWAMQFLGKPIPAVIPGIDLMYELCKISEREGYRIYLLGGEKEVIEKTVLRLKERFPQIKFAGWQDGYFSPEEEKEIVREIRNLSPDILFLALGSPKQEKWANAYLKELNTNLVIGLGGSFDIISGKLRRAPVRLRRIGLEWLFRLYQEPRRIKKIIQLPVFVSRVILSRIHTN